jgi:thiosulfate/3-mercaptopyruvate sulfurtransferase
MSYINEKALVSTDWLERNLRSPRIKILDASWYLPDQGRNARAEFREAHIPGANFFDIDEITDRTSPYPHTIPGPGLFAEEMPMLGVNNADHVIIYDGSGLFSAARAWWLFRVFGHDRVSILDGGFPKWRAEGRPVDDGGPPPADFAGAFDIDVRRSMVRSIDDMRANLDSGAEQVIDARGPGRFTGSEPEPREGVRSGHIPGSRNLPYGSILTADGTVKAADDLTALFNEAGIGEGPVVTSCGSGVTACALAFALHLVGRDDVAVYDGSWSEWGAQADTPVETGS